MNFTKEFKERPILRKKDHEIKFVETTIRDGQQCLMATRMPNSDILPILNEMDNAGFYAIEAWGGATFDAALRFLKEDPWENLQNIKSKLKKTKLQMLFRGQNMLGYKAYHDEIVSEFIKYTIQNGVDIIRIFDALNDLRNLETSINATKKYGGNAQLTLCYTISPVHTIDYFVNIAKELENMGADSIAIKDMSGILLPDIAYDLVSSIKQNTNLPLEIHTHCTGGMADMVYLKAVEAGVDIINTASSPFALGTSQPSTEVMNAVFNSLGYKTNLNVESLTKIAKHFRPLREKALQDGLIDPQILGVDIETLIYQVPGGMLSNLVSQLKQQRAMDKFPDVLKEISNVRADMGYVPLVTPSSQIIGAQATFNVLLGERYKMVSKEVKDLVKGMYGKTPAPISDKIKNKILGNEEPITVSPKELTEPVLKSSKIAIQDYIRKPEDILTYALFPHVAMDYFRFREGLI
ncbi:MAG: pyruvate carboxylase subunit B [Defluviitaleaceae bacterium]|nr:pyruvate carboxylase subunit B [Defluviitaleaceae bacterium]